MLWRRFLAEVAYWIADGFVRVGSLFYESPEEPVAEPEEEAVAIIPLYMNGHGAAEIIRHKEQPQ